MEYDLGREASQNRVKSITDTQDGTVWVGTISGLQKMASGSASFKPVPEVEGTVRVMREMSDGTLWIGTIGRGVVTYRDHHFSGIAMPDPLPSNPVLNLFEDVERNVWIGTQGGMLRLIKTPVRTVKLPDAADSDAETVYQDRSGDPLGGCGKSVPSITMARPLPIDFPAYQVCGCATYFRDQAREPCG